MLVSVVLSSPRVYQFKRLVRYIREEEEIACFAADLSWLHVMQRVCCTSEIEARHSFRFENFHSFLIAHCVKNAWRNCSLSVCGCSDGKLWQVLMRLLLSLVQKSYTGASKCFSNHKQIWLSKQVMNNRKWALITANKTFNLANSCSRLLLRNCNVSNVCFRWTLIRSDLFWTKRQSKICANFE